MKKKRLKWDQISNINETFSLFEFLLKDEEKANFKALVEKSETSNKIRDRKEFYQEIQKLLLRTNFMQFDKYEDDFKAYASRSSYEINNMVADYKDQQTNHISPVDKTEILAK